MYDNYDDDYLDFLEDELDSYDSEIEEYNDDLSSLADDMVQLRDEYESKIKEIDEYWNQENAYIQGSGIYTQEEVQQILANHEEIRRSKKQEAAKEYREGIAMLRGERGQIMFDKEMAEFSIDCVQNDIEFEQLSRGMSREDSSYDDMLRARREEQAAYDDFIASIDMDR